MTDKFISIEAIAKRYPHPGGDEVAVFAIISKATHFKDVPQAGMAEFDFRAKTDVAGEQAEEGRFGQGAQVVNKIHHAFAVFGRTL